MYIKFPSVSYLANFVSATVAAPVPVIIGQLFYRLLDFEENNRRFSNTFARNETEGFSRRRFRVSFLIRLFDRGYRSIERV